MALSITNRLTSSYFSTFPCSFSVSIFIILFILPFLIPTQAQSRLCRKSCGGIPIQYPFGLDDGCGSPYYRHILVCTADMLEFRTPSGRYAVKNINYSDPHILVTDPFMWNCLDGDNFRPTRPFSLDTRTHFTLSPQNDYLFFNCSENDVIIERKPTFCERFPEQCDSTCDSSSYLCRYLPECANGLRSSSCCSYYPKATESLRLMLKHCATYTSVYWRNLGVTPAFNEVPEYGIRVDFDIPVTTRCLKCQDSDKGDGICGFHTERLNFLCLCNKGNSTTNCNDSENSHRKPGVVAETATAVSVSVAGAFGIGVGVWYLKKVRAKAPVTHGVQSNENRLF